MQVKFVMTLVKLNNNVSKTEVVLFKSLKNQTDSELHLKLYGK